MRRGKPRRDVPQPTVKMHRRPNQHSGFPPAAGTTRPRSHTHFPLHTVQEPAAPKRGAKERLRIPWLTLPCCGHLPQGSRWSILRPPTRPACGLPRRPGWWRQTGSNRRPPACKAGALPTELCPRSNPDLASQTSAVSPFRGTQDTTPEMVGQGGFEPPTSRLSSARSNQLSY